MYNKTYLFIAGYAAGRGFQYTPKALPLARKLHNGQYRKSTITINDNTYKIPYVLHVLKVCSMLIAFNIPMSNNDLDILYTCALLHDAIEDAEEYFPNGGVELTRDYGFPQIVTETIQMLSKRSGASEYELNEYFNNIKRNKFALLIKLADRSHNVESLYNIKDIPKYIKETRDFFLSKNSLCAYGRQNYPELSNAITVLKAKIASLTDATETMLHINKDHLAEKDREIEELKKRLAEK